MLLLHLMLALWCSPPGGAGIALREVAVFDGGLHGVFLDIEGAAFCRDGTWFAADKLSYRILRLDPRGTVTANAGGRGRTEGRFAGPGAVAAYGDTVIAADFASSRVLTFSRDLWYLRTFRTPGPVFDMHFTPGGSLWIACHGEQITGVLLRCTADGQERQRIMPKNVSGSLFNDVFRFSPGPHGMIVLAYMTQNVLEVWDTAGTFRRSFSIPGLPVRSSLRVVQGKPGEKGYEIPEEALFRDIAVDREGKIFVLSDGYSDHPRQDVYVCTAEGRLITSFVLPEKTSSFWFGPDGSLYAVTGNRDVVRKYAVSYHGH